MTCTYYDKEGKEILEKKYLNKIACNIGGTGLCLVNFANAATKKMKFRNNQNARVFFCNGQLNEMLTFIKMAIFNYF